MHPAGGVRTSDWLPPATVVSVKQCFHNRVSRILYMGEGVCIVKGDMCGEGGMHGKGGEGICGKGGHAMHGKGACMAGGHVW